KTISDLELDKIHKDFFACDKKSTNFDSKCNVFDEKSKNNPHAKKLCSSLVYYLEKIREMNTQQKSNKYCGYLPYWLYDKIGKIHNPSRTKIDKVPFYEEFNKAGNAISGGKLKHPCVVRALKNVDLNELKNRKFSYIYFKNFGSIYNINTSKNEDGFAKYLTYRESFNPLYEAYKKTLCYYILFPRTGPDYFPCSYKYDLKNLMSGLKNCKEGKDPYPKAPVAVTSRTVRSGTGAAAGETGARGSPGSAGTGGTVRTTSTTAVSIQAGATSLAGASQPRAGILTMRSGGTPQLAQRPPGCADLTHVTGDTLSALPGVVTPPSGFSERASEMLKSNSFRHTLVGGAIICGLVFLFFFFKVRTNWFKNM
ncbi:VIR-like CYIR protein, partial [Plasmodium cynomolgi strain B]